MKRLILISLFFILSLGTFAQMITFTSTHFCKRYPVDSLWTAWTPAEMTIIWNTDDKRIIIGSYNIQIIDYDTLSYRFFNEGIVYSGYANDSKYVGIGIEIWIYDTSVVVIKVIYSNIMYKYRMMLDGAESKFSDPQLKYSEDEIRKLEKNCLFKWMT